MTSFQINPNSEVVTQDDLRELAAQAGPTVSIVVSTHRGGAETVADARKVKPLVEQARADLAANYPDTDADKLLAPVEALADDADFWQVQADALMIFASPSGVRTFRTQLEVQDQVSVGDFPNIRPMLPLIADNQPFLLLTVSQNKLRIFEGDRTSITELPLGAAPASVEDSDYYTREPQMQHQASGDAGAHGHSVGLGAVREGFLRDVAKSFNQRFSNDPRPVILAAVSEHRGDMVDHLTNVNLLEDGVVGNPDDLSARELHEKAWPIAAVEADRRYEALLERFNINIGTGLATHDAARISADAANGRVDTLLISQIGLHEATFGGQASPEDLDAAVAHTLRNRGDVGVVKAFNEERAAGAIFRY